MKKKFGKDEGKTIIIITFQMKYYNPSGVSWSNLIIS